MSDHEHAPAPSGRQIHYHHITVQPITPPEPLVVCSPGFITQLAAVEHELASIEIKDDASLQRAAEIQNRITKAGKMLEETRAKLKAPFIAKGKEIDAAAKAPAERIEKLKEQCGAKLVAYRERTRVAAEKAELARQAELARLPSASASPISRPKWSASVSPTRPLQRPLDSQACRRRSRSISATMTTT
jgi:hypothetical protein